MKARVLKGFRDIQPRQVAMKQRFIAILRQTFASFGFLPLETPGLEYADVLAGKYGKEAEKLFYIFKDRGGRKVGLPYDLTVPVSRFLATHPQIKMPFRRYQIQNVFRAEKPQRGRFREFTQCDVDIFGSASPLADSEIILTLAASLKALGFKKFSIKINSRQLLNEILAAVGINQAKKQQAILRALDKKEKISPKAFREELLNAGLSKDLATTFLAKLEKSRPDDNLKRIFAFLQAGGLEEGKQWQYDPWLTRGLDYYTGMVFEIFLDDETVGAIAGGGRYDSLINQLGGPVISAVGGSIGLDRLMAVAEERNLWSEISAAAQVLVTIFNSELALPSLRLAQQLRKAGIKTELYLNEKQKLSRQIKYANRRGIRYAIILGPDEIAEKKITLKNLQKRQQKQYSLKEILAKLTS